LNTENSTSAPAEEPKADPNSIRQTTDTLHSLLSLILFGKPRTASAGSPAVTLPELRPRANV
jgi:hypothetical protein